MRLRSLVLPATFALGAAGGGCFTDTNTTTGSVSSTLLTVRPETFRGAVACGDVAGAMKTYVATLTDATEGLQPFDLPSSNPVPCSVPVSFGYSVPGHSYRAHIEAYDTTSLAPLGGLGSGSPRMVDPSGAPVVPTWTTTCGAGDLGDAGASNPDASTTLDAALGPDANGVADDPFGLTLSYAFADVQVRGCRPLVRSGTVPSRTAVLVDLAPALGGLACGAAAGQIDKLVVTPVASGLAPRTLGCTPPDAGSPAASTTFDAVAGVLYAFDVAAYGAGAAAPTWGARCSIVAQSGLTLPAKCGALSSTGGVHLSLAAALASAGQACAGDTRDYAVRVSGQTAAPQPGPCSADVLVAPLAPGAYTLDVEVVGQEPTATPVAHCTATVAPGLVAEAACAP